MSLTAASTGNAEVQLAVLRAGAEHRSAFPGGILDLVFELLDRQPLLVLARPQQRSRRLLPLLRAAGGSRRSIRGSRESPLGCAPCAPDVVLGCGSDGGICLQVGDFVLMLG